MPVDIVGDTEMLNRSIRASDCRFESGRWRISTQAFNDAGRKPSVDRQLLRPDPIESKKNASDGVAELLTSEIRTSICIPINGEQPQGMLYRIDVIARPIDGEPSSPEHNPAHAQIEADPHWLTDSRFRKLKESLARLAALRPWVISPET